MTIDESSGESNQGETRLLHKRSRDVKLLGIKTCEGLYEVKMKACNDSLNIVTSIKYKAWDERLGHCGNEALRKYLRHIQGVN